MDPMEENRFINKYSIHPILSCTTLNTFQLQDTRHKIDLKTWSFSHCSSKKSKIFFWQKPFREVEKLPWHVHRRPSQFSAITDRDTDEEEDATETENETARRVPGKVKFGQPDTETETEEAEPSAHAFEKPLKKKRHSRKKEWEILDFLNFFYLLILW